MVLLSMLPIGLMQTWASVEYGTWYARSAEFLHTPMLNSLRWMRMFGDTLFALRSGGAGMVCPGLNDGHSGLKTRRGSLTSPVGEKVEDGVTVGD